MKHIYLIITQNFRLEKIIQTLNSFQNNYLNNVSGKSTFTLALNVINSLTLI